MSWLFGRKKLQHETDFNKSFTIPSDFLWATLNSVIFDVFPILGTTLTEFHSVPYTVSECFHKMKNNNNKKKLLNAQGKNKILTFLVHITTPF